jgi:hypothetical protein
MPLNVVTATHVRVICDACGFSAEVCGKRELALAARANATRIFGANGWHHDPAERGRLRALESAQREGMGRWYCPKCASRTHM